MLSQTSYHIVGWRLLENDVVPLLPRRVHVAADIDPDESGGVIRWSYLHDPATGGLYDAHTGRQLGETLDEAMESAELLEQRLGVRLDDWYGKTDAEVWPRTTAEAFRKNDRGAAAPGSAERSTWHLESQSRRRNGVGNR